MLEGVKRPDSMKAITTLGDTAMATRILRLPGVQYLTGLSRSTIYLRISNGDFPKPIPLGGRAVGWDEKEVEEWLQHQIQKARES